MARFKKQIKIGALLGLVLLLVLPGQAHGNWVSAGIMLVLDNVVSFVVYYISLAITTLASQFFILAGAIVDLMLNLNQKILQSPFVLSGFSISLSVANLGFVLAIILIAFATILDLSSYGMKQTLRNLIIAAVLVNFSLSIAGVILDFTGVLGNFFMEQIAPGAFSKGSVTLSSALANVFLINTLQKPAGLSSAIGTSFDRIINMVLAMIFTIVFTFIAIVVMLAVGILYFGRYLILSVLLVLMPLAWLFWVLPGLEGHFKNWWSAFLRWAFFLPASSFFFYVTILTLKNLNNYTPPQKLTISLSIDNLVNMALALGFISGSLIVADKMSLAGASAFLGAAKGMQGWAFGKVKKGGKLTGEYFARKALPKERLEKAQERISGLAEKVRFPGGKQIVGLADRVVSGAVARTARFGAEDAVKDAEKRFKDMTTEQIKAVLLAATNPEKAAALKVLTERGDLNKINAGQYNTDSTKAAFESIGEGKAFSEFQKGIGISMEANKLLRVNADKLSSVGGKLQSLINSVSTAGTDAELKAAQESLAAFRKSGEYGDYENVVSQIGQEQAKFFAGFTDEDRDKPQWGHIYSNKDAFGLSGGLKTAFQQATSMGVASGRTGMMPRIAPKLKSEEFDNYKVSMVGRVDWKKDDPITSGAIAGLTGEKRANAEKSFTRTHDWRVLGIEPGSKKGAEKVTAEKPGGESEEKT